uniref:Uncharacterized protein n=1 Tax=Arundo donax TaxID=35708 RepID=A0A0A9DRW6_ARUDO
MATTPPTRFSYSTLSNPASWIICANFSCKSTGSVRMNAKCEQRSLHSLVCCHPL